MMQWIVRIAVVMLFIANTASGTGVEAGFVEDYSGDASGYRLERDGERVSVGVLTPVHAGDRLFVDDPSGRIRLRLGEARAVTLTKRAAPFEVPAAADGATVLGNLARWAVGWTESDGGSGPSSVALTTRSGALSLPLCPDGVEQRIPAGASDLALAWRGGVAPYTVRWLAGETEVAAVSDVFETQAELARVEPAGAALSIEVVDARGDRVRVPVRIARDGETSRSLLTHVGARSELSHVLRAFEALEALGDAGRLVAFQYVNAVAETYAPAAAVRDALAAGRMPGTAPPHRAPRK